MGSTTARTKAVGAGIGAVVLTLVVGAAGASAGPSATTASRATFAEEDAQLNARYQALLAKTRPAARRALVEAQRAWIRFRDLECKSQVAASGPSNIHDELVHDCLDSVTYERRVELERQLQCPGVEGIICDAGR